MKDDVKKQMLTKLITIQSEVNVENDLTQMGLDHTINTSKVLDTIMDVISNNQRAKLACAIAVRQKNIYMGLNTEDAVEDAYAIDDKNHNVQHVSRQLKNILNFCHGMAPEFLVVTSSNIRILKVSDINEIIDNIHAAVSAHFAK